MNKLFITLFILGMIFMPLVCAFEWSDLNPFTWFNEDTGETIEYDIPYNETYEEPIQEEYNNSENIYDIKGFRYKNYRIIQTGDEYYYDVILDNDIKNGKLKIKVQKENYGKSIVPPPFLELKDEKGNILSIATLEIKGNKYEYNFEQNKKEKKVKIGKNSITIIKISDAEYLNSSRDLIENIYDYVKAEDNITYSVTNGNYIRTNFEQQLKNGNDISIYAAGNGSIEIYKEGTNDLVGTISGISSYKKYSTMISNLISRTDTFDLKIIGDLEIDYIVDPTGYFTFQIETTTPSQTFAFQTDNAADLLILWGDGTNETVSGTGLRSHSYSTAGTYNISLNGQATRIAFGGTGTTPTLLKDVLTKMSDGLTGINSAFQMFTGCIQITTFTEPAFFDAVSGNVTTLHGMFQGATAFNQPLNNWDTSSITSMQAMFLGATSFNQSLNSWNTSSVTAMNNMFYGASSFNQPLNSWNTSSVTTMASMFLGATSFNQDLDNWDTSKITNFYRMFYEATSFNQPLNNWNTSSVTSMDSMFYQATNFNKPLNNWDTSKVTNMQAMFYGATSFNQPLDSWNTSSVTGSINSMFQSATSFNQPLNNWDVSKVTTMANMFNGATSFNQSLNSWDTSKVTSMGNMFYQATNFNGDISNWNTSSVTDMRSVFYYASSFNQLLNSWDTSRVEKTSQMFQGATSFNQSLNNWNTSNLREANNMFLGATSFNQDLDNWDMSSAINIGYMFHSATNFNGNISNWNTSNVQYMNNMFINAINFNGDISNWNTSSVTHMLNMFQGATSFNQPIGNWDTSKVKTMSEMFRLATAFNQDISNWDTSSVTTMASMFQDAKAFNQPLNDWDTSKVTSMNFMFQGASSFKQDVSNWNVSSVTAASGMFNYITLPTVVYDGILIKWSNQTLKTGVNIHFGGSKYSLLANSSRALLQSKGWTITDGGLYTDTIKPTITINSPLNQTYSTKLISVDINATDDTYLDKVWYDIGEGNTTYTSPFIYNFDLGSHEIKAYANDTWGNFNSTSTFFEVTCITNYTNTSWSEWEDLGVCSSIGVIQQSRFLVSYDQSGCGAPNITYTEYREAGCTYMDIVPIQVSLLNCNIPNTNPLCLTGITETETIAYGGLYFYDSDGVSFTSNASWQQTPAPGIVLKCSYGRNIACNSTSGVLTVLTDSIYEVQHIASIEMGNNVLFESAIAVNGIIQENTISNLYTAAGKRALTTGFGRVQVFKDDNITLMFRSPDGTYNGEAYQLNYIVKRLGE